MDSYQSPLVSRPKMLDPITIYISKDSIILICQSNSLETVDPYKPYFYFPMGIMLYLGIR